MSKYGQKNAIRFESVLNQSTAKVYTDGSKLNGRVGKRLFMPNTQTTPQNKHFSTLEFTALCSRQIVLAISEVAKNLLLDKMHNQSIVALV